MRRIEDNVDRDGSLPFSEELCGRRSANGYFEASSEQAELTARFVMRPKKNAEVIPRSLRRDEDQQGLHEGSQSTLRTDHLVHHSSYHLRSDTR